MLRSGQVRLVCVGISLVGTLLFAGETQAGGIPVRASVGTIGSSLIVGPLDISATSVLTTTCGRRGHPGMQPPTLTRSGWEWLYVVWTLHNPHDRDYSLPNASRPGFRLVGEHRLFPGFYASYPGYLSVVSAHGDEEIHWTFAIRRGTRRATLTYLPPGPQAVHWVVRVPAPPPASLCR